MASNQDELSYTHREQLTIGIEIESACLIEVGDPIFTSLNCSKYALQSSRSTWNEDLYRQVFQERKLLPALENAGLRTYLGSDQYSTRPSMAKLRQTHHEICTDSSLVADPGTKAYMAEHNKLTGKELIWVPFEISTPPMVFDGELGDKIEKLTAVLRGLGARVAESTAIHVHVGNGVPSTGYPLQLLKNLFLMWTMFSTQLEQLHPHCRAVSEYCKSPMAQFISDDLEWVSSQIDNCPTLVDFLELAFIADPVVRLMEWGDCNDSKKYRYKAINCKPLEYGGQKTIEFRSLQTTLHTYQITRWVHTIVDILHIAGTRKFSELKQLVAGRKYVRNFEENANILQVFHVLGLHHLADIWEGDIYKHDEESIPRVPHHDPCYIEQAMERWKKFQEDFAKAQAANSIDEDRDWPEVEW